MNEYFSIIFHQTVYNHHHYPRLKMKKRQKQKILERVKEFIFGTAQTKIQNQSRMDSIWEKIPIVANVLFYPQRDYEGQKSIKEGQSDQSRRKGNKRIGPRGKKSEGVTESDHVVVSKGLLDRDKGLLDRVLQFGPVPEVEDNVVMDYLEIFRPEGYLIIGSSGNESKKSEKIKPYALEQIRREIVENCRKLHLEAYEKDIIELLISISVENHNLKAFQSDRLGKVNGSKLAFNRVLQNYYVFYKVHRDDVIIFSVSCTTYSYANAEEIIERTIGIYDEEIFTLFSQFKLPKIMTHTYWRKLMNLNKRLRGLLQEENNMVLKRKKEKKGDKLKKGFLIEERTEKNMREIAQDCLILYNEENKMIRSFRKAEEIEQKTEVMRENTNRIVRMMGLRNIGFYFLLILNFLLIVYLVREYY